MFRHYKVVARCIIGLFTDVPGLGLGHRAAHAWPPWSGGFLRRRLADQVPVPREQNVLAFLVLPFDP